MGITTVLLTDGTTSILVDGYFSRPGPIRTLLGRIGPNEDAIKQGLARAQIEQLAVVLVAHSHHDHALDAAIVAHDKNALLVGSGSTLNIVKGSRYPETPFHLVQDKEQLTFGTFKVTTFKSRHSPCPPSPGSIKEPLETPARANDFKEGGSYTFLVSRGDRSILIHPSANFVPGMYRDTHADVVFLGIARLAKQPPSFAKEYWREVVQATGAKIVVPMHWDDFAQPVGDSFVPSAILWDDADGAMKLVRDLAEDNSVDLRLMPPFEAVDLESLSAR
jgi:L-ascorbate metabolism protein UlaG (beta-lactamase superfamily)